jgi:hypothetical protein
MKFKLLFVLLLTISCSASAQWYNINISNFSFKKHLRFAQIAEVKNNPLKRLTITKFTHKSIIPKLTFTGDNDFELEAAEDVIMRSAQHHMRFREYDEASYEFTDLAELYIKQNRFSEAKWYLLQSNAITRPQADDMHTITNLMDLAMVKANIGELLQSQQDLDEAHGLAMAKGWIAKVTDIEKEQQFIKINKTASSPKMELRYASDAGVIDTKVADKKTD